MPSSTGARCQAHPAEPAGWSCQACGEALCVGCCVRRKAGEGWLVVCRHCGGHAAPILVQRGGGSYAGLLPGAFVYPFSKRGLLTLVALGLVLGPLYMFGPMPALLAAASFCSYLFVVVRTSALGEDDVPESEDFANPFDLLVAFVKVLVAFALTAVPFVLYVWKLKGPLPAGHEPAAITRYFLGDPLVYLSLALGLAWAPMALVLAAVNSAFGSIVNPVLAAKAIRRLGGDFVLAAGAFWAMGVASLLMGGVGYAFRQLVPLPIVPRMVAESFACYFPLVGARMLGLLLFARGADLGYGRTRDYQEPVLGDVQPPVEQLFAQPLPAQAAEVAQVSPALAASLKATDPTERRPASALDITFDLPEMPQPPVLEGVLEEAPPVDPSSAPTILEMPSSGLVAAPQSGDLMPEEDFLAQAHLVAKPVPPPPPPVLAAPASRPPAAKGAPPSDAQVLSLVAAGKWDVVAAAYRARLGDVTVLDAEQLLKTADAALARRDLQTASHALKRAGYDHPASPLAPAALLRAAKLLSVEMKKPAEGAKVASHLVQRHPQTREAQDARALLPGAR